MRISDWSSDVCSSDLGIAIFLLTFDPNAYKSKLESIVYNRYHRTLAIKGDLELSLFPRIGLSVQDRKSVVLGKRVSERVDLGGRRIIKKKNQERAMYNRNIRCHTSQITLEYQT